jgi:serine/threonine protein kinase
MQAFQTVKELGAGAFGSVVLAERNLDGKKVAIKMISKAKKQEANIKREVMAGKLLRHKKIVSFVGHKEDEHHDYLIFDYIAGCDLYSMLERRSFVGFLETEARSIMHQLVSALLHSHELGVVHLDVKLDNIMINPKDLSVTLIDYGLCDFVTKENRGMFSRRCGSIEYCAAEILSHQKPFKPFDGFKVDVWSLGVVLYALLSATFPFDTKKKKAILQATGRHPEVYIHFTCSEPAKDLIKKMLSIDPEKRITMKEVSNHPWMKL